MEDVGSARCSFQLSFGPFEAAIAHASPYQKGGAFGQASISVLNGRPVVIRRLDDHPSTARPALAARREAV